jgi:GH15 family glucan-1,4-alpha-glucosidase
LNLDIIKLLGLKMDIFKCSIDVILQNQDKGGAYVACPSFPTYQFCWLRDGSYIAAAMDRVEEYESAEKFYRWVGSTIMRYSIKINVLEDQLKSGKVPDQRGILHTRFTIEGLEESSDSGWGNFQIDGYGTWLWALTEHVRRSGDTTLLKELNVPVQITLRYLELAWKLPNHDCWEEHPEYLHPYSLATVFSGLNSIASLVHAGQIDAGPVAADELAGQVKNFILKYGVHDGRLVKHISPERSGESPRPIPQNGVDSSLIGVAFPCNVLPPDSPVMQATMQAIEADLHRPGGGVYRYRSDVYYGGGEWLLLTAWLGWYYTRTGELEKAQACKEWIESKANAEGFFPEQVSDHTLAPSHFRLWQKKWGPVASPLLWSHAMYILLVKSIEELME